MPNLSWSPGQPHRGPRRPRPRQPSGWRVFVTSAGLAGGQRRVTAVSALSFCLTLLSIFSRAYSRGNVTCGEASVQISHPLHRVLFSCCPAAGIRRGSGTRDLQQPLHVKPWCPGPRASPARLRPPSLSFPFSSASPFVPDGFARVSVSLLSPISLGLYCVFASRSISLRLRLSDTFPPISSRSGFAFSFQLLPSEISVTGLPGPPVGAQGCALPAASVPGRLCA